MKKGRHRRYEEARAMKRGPDLDIEGILDDLSSDRDVRAGDPEDFDVLQEDSALDGPGRERAGREHGDREHGVDADDEDLGDGPDEVSA